MHCRLVECRGRRRKKKKKRRRRRKQNLPRKSPTQNSQSRSDHRRRITTRCLNRIVFDRFLIITGIRSFVQIFARARRYLLTEISGMAGDHGNVHVVDSKRAWDSKIDEAQSTGKVVVVDFTATWCGPCRLMSPIFTELSKKYPSLIFLKVDVDEVPDVTSEWEIRAMPTFLFIKDGKQIDKIVGANKDELEKKVQYYASLSKSLSTA